MLTKVIEQAKIDHFTKWFERADKIVIVSHVSPDGDAIGSSLGLYHFLDSQEKTVNVIVPNAFPDFLRWMPGSKDILLYDRYKDFADKLIAEADVICCLDFNALKRIDDMADAVAASPARKVMIDHHLYPEEFCKITMSYPKISSTSELIFRLICRMGYFSDISKEGAECIYTGMMTDTGGFTYNSNNREIYFIISELLSKGIDKDDIYRKVYNTYSESRLRLMGYVLSNMVVYSDYNAALISLTKEEQSKFDYIKGDSEGFVNIPLTIKNVCFSCFLREDTEKPMIKISLRSVGTFPCNQLAADTGVCDKITLLHFLCAAKSKAGTLNRLFGQVKPFSAAFIDDKDSQCASGCRIRVDLVHIGILFKQPGKQLALQLPHLSPNRKRSTVHGVLALHAGQCKDSTLFQSVIEPFSPCC